VPCRNKRTRGSSTCHYAGAGFPKELAGARLLDAPLVGEPKSDLPQEVLAGYIWSPKRNANGARNPFYESMREVAPGDLIFSFRDTRILAGG
jgi:hypothetical protein